MRDTIINAKTLMWSKVKQLTEQGLRSSQIAKDLQLDRRTVVNYQSMDSTGYFTWIDSLSQRKKKLDEYEPFIVSQLKICNDFSASQIEDKLAEKYGLKDLCSKTVYNFVQYVRQKHDINKTSRSPKGREVLEESDYGEFAQVDFGETIIRTKDGSTKKIYFFCIVLSRSRHKFVWHQSTPFTSKSAIEAHQRAKIRGEGHSH